MLGNLINRGMKHFILIIIALVFLSAHRSDPKEDTSAKIKVVYLYNFSKYIDWPEDYKSGSFIITVIGNSPSLLSELSKMATQKKAGSQDISIKSISSVSDLNKSNIVFVPAENSGQLNEIISKLKGRSTLVVSEKPGSIKQGSAINFIVQENKQKFELCKTNAERSKLKVSSSLLPLAILVD